MNIKTISFAALGLIIVQVNNSVAQEDGQIVSDKDKVNIVEDANLDDALKKRPDLDFENLSVDQENSDVSLSTIPAQAVEKAEVLKAATPDLDADTRGQILKVKYKPSYKLNSRLFNGRVYTRYKAIYDSHSPMADITYANKLADNFGFRGTLEYQDSIRGSDELRFQWSDQPALANDQYYIDTINLINDRRNYTTTRFNGSLDYRFSEGNDIYLRYSYDNVEYNSTSGVTQLRFGSENDFSQLNSTSGSVDGARLQKTGIVWEQQDKKSSLTLGGNLTGFNSEVEWRIQQNDEISDIPSRRIGIYRNNNASFSYNNSLDDFPEINFPSENEPNNYILNNFDHVRRIEDYDTTIIAVDWQWKPSFLKDKDAFKFGLKSSMGEGDEVRNIRSYNISDNVDISLADHVSQYMRDDFIGRGFSYGFQADGQSTADYVNTYPDFLELNELVSSLRSGPGTFSTNQDINALYGMFNWQLNKLRIVSGLRYEKTDLSSLGNIATVMGDEVDIQSKSAENTYSNWFPGLHLRYQLSPSLTFIGSYTSTIRRPSYEDVAPFRVTLFTRREINEGNPELKPELYDNFKLALDYQPDKNLLVSWELFSEKIEDTIFLSREAILDGPFTGFNIKQYRNGGEADRAGTTLFFKQTLQSNSGAPSPVSWSLNYTYTDSSAENEQRPGEDFPLTEMPEHFLQWYLNYQDKKLFLQFGIDAYSDQLATISPLGPEKDTYITRHYYVNFRGDYKINSKYTAFLDWKNLNEEYEELSHEGSGRVERYKHDPWIILAGVRFEL